MKACQERGITVCGTTTYGNPTTGIAFGLMLELTRRIGWENARMKAGESWQLTLGMGMEGKTLGLLGRGKLGARASGGGTTVGTKWIAAGPQLTPDSRRESGGAYEPQTQQ